MFRVTHWKKLSCVCFSLPRTGTRYMLTQSWSRPSTSQTDSCAVVSASFTNFTMSKSLLPSNISCVTAVLCMCHTHFAPQEFATERELCWHLCITLGLAKQHERLAHALSQTGINEKNQPSEYRAKAQVAHACQIPMSSSMHDTEAFGTAGFTRFSVTVASHAFVQQHASI